MHDYGCPHTRGPPPGLETSDSEEMLPFSTKRVFFVRHGQSQAQVVNVLAQQAGEKAPDVTDPKLSPMGLQQAHALQLFLRDFLPHEHIELVVASPLTRALQTALVGVEEALYEPVPVLVTPLHTERSENACDCGRAPAELKKDFPSVDFGLVPEQWWRCRHGGNHEDVEGLCARAGQFVEWLKARPEAALVVVGHGNFFRQLLGEPRMENCEVRLWEGEVGAESKLVTSSLFVPDFGRGWDRKNT